MIKDTLNKLISNRNTELAACKEELQKLMARIDELEKINDESNNEEELKAAGAELDYLKAKKSELEVEIQGKQAELDEINAQIAELDKPIEDQPQRSKLNFMKREERGKMTREEMETRAANFAKTEKMAVEVTEARATLVSGGKVLTNTGIDGITDTFNEVSSIIDLVKVENCEGMGSNKIAYQKTNASASTQTEGSATTPSDPTFDFVEITGTDKQVLSYISEKARRQKPLDYEAKVRTSAMTGLRVAAATIVTDAIKSSALLDRLAGTVASSKGVINEKTLRNLVFSYGGAENVEGQAWLFLNKADLIAFGDVRGTNEKKAVYEIIPNATNPNIGQIKDGGLTVNYCINSNCVKYSGTSQPLSSGSDLVTMLYGNPRNCELDLFSDYEVKVSEDYKFAEGLLTVRGTASLGAGVIHDKGFVALVLPKAAA